MDSKNGAQRKVVPNEPILKEVGRLISEGHSTTLIVRGNSMNPMLVNRRDKVVLSPFSQEQLQPGAVVLARTDQHKFVLHRIIRRTPSDAGKENDLLLLMGDGNCVGTERTTPALVLGLMTAFVRKEKYQTCQSRTWRCYSTVWVQLHPIRRYLLAFYRKIINRHITYN